MNSFFKKALPVWADGYETQMNITCGFYTAFVKGTTDLYLLSITASSLYRVFINGQFFQYGPVRAAHGVYRVDKLDMSEFLREGINHIAIEVAGYNINGFYVIDQPSFVQAEITDNNKVIAATHLDDGDFDCYILDNRIRKIQRYSYQRAFSESYRLNDTYESWRIGGIEGVHKVKLIKTSNKTLIERGLPYHQFKPISPINIIGKGSVRTGVYPEVYQKDRSLTIIGDNLKGFREDELELHLTDEVQELQYYDKDKLCENYNSSEIFLSKNRYITYKFCCEKSGFIGVHVKCKAKGVIYILFDETLNNDDVNPISMQCTNVIKIYSEEGAYNFISFESYGLMYLKLVCIEGEFAFSDIKIYEYICPLEIKTDFNSNDEKLNLIYEAAVETFRQNSTDLFMDCPTRERGGWLCDSFFTARVENLLTGSNLIEQVFLQNFLLAKKFDNLPDGMMPMCYPADHFNGQFISNWALWFLIELEDYLKRTGDSAFIEKFHDMVYRVLNYFTPFENEYGLLEKLESWVFVEWSKANDLVQDINYPTNMLYAGALNAVGNMYKDKDLIQKSIKIKETIRKRSFDGEYFVDNEIRQDSKLTLSGERSETCQYYAFFFDVATPELYPKLWELITTEFGPDRLSKNLHMEIYPSNAFIGNYLRLDILTRYGLKDLTLQEIKQYFYYMAVNTGTLWETITDKSSCNHGFASYAAYLIDKNYNKLNE